MNRPYPNRDRALRHIQRTRAAYQYGRSPQRWVLGIDPGARLGDPGAVIAARAQARVRQLGWTTAQMIAGTRRLGKTAIMTTTANAALARGEHVHLASARGGVRCLNQLTEQDPT